MEEENLSQPQTWQREIFVLEAAALRALDAERILVVHERPQRAPPASIQLVDAWRYLLGESAERPLRRGLKSTAQSMVCYSSSAYQPGGA